MTVYLHLSAMLIMYCFAVARMNVEKWLKTVLLLFFLFNGVAIVLNMYGLWR